MQRILLVSFRNKLSSNTLGLSAVLFILLINLNSSEPWTAPSESVIETRCRYIIGKVNHPYEREVRHDEAVVFVFPIEKKYLDAANTNLRVEVEVEQRTSLQDPILFSVAQRKFTSTFELPQTFESPNENRTNPPVYYTAGRNICLPQRASEGQNITIRVTTSFSGNRRFRLKLHLSQDFQLPLGTPISLDVSPTNPKYLGFQTSRPDVSVIKIKASSDSNLCLTLSVQTPQCPIYDKEVNVQYQGLWQTMTTQTAMTLEMTKRFQNGFVVVLVAHDSDYNCAKSGYINPYQPPPLQPPPQENQGPVFGTDLQRFGTNSSLRIKTVTLLLTNEGNAPRWSVFLVLFIPIFTTILLIVVVKMLFRNRHQWLRIEAEQKLCILTSGLLSSIKEDHRPQRLLISQPSDDLVLHDLGVLPTPPGDDDRAFPSPQRRGSDYARAPSKRFYSSKTNGHDGGICTTSKPGFRWKADLTIADFEQKDPAMAKKAGRRFYWTIVIVAIFYCIPVYQLILHYLRVLYRTGEYDICYYNYLCAHRLGLFVDFNHFWSNVSYIIFGFAFIFFVNRRANSMQNLKVPKAINPENLQSHKRNKRKSGEFYFDDETEETFLKRCCGYSNIPTRSDHGIPHNWGIFYTMGIALAMEGVLSAAYHLCPNQSSFQFDTCFMYVIAVLILLKIYQFRHSVHFGADHTFLILATFVLISVVGLMFEFQGSKSRMIYRWTFIAIQFFTMTLLAIYFYSFGYVRCRDSRRMLTGWKLFCNLDQMNNGSFGWDRLFLPILSFLLGIAVLIYCELADIDFATYLLYVLVANVIGATTYYVGIMKPLHGEFKNRTWVQPVIYLVGAGVVGGFAVKYFVRSPAAWELSAAASRAGNEECMNSWFPFYPYYDSHDVWHFLSSASLFLSFMALLIVDDDLVTTPQHKIHVF